MYRKVLERMFRATHTGGFEVVWEDGKRSQYGPDQPEFVIHFKSRDVARRIIMNPSIGFGECYSNGKIEVEGDLHDVMVLVSHNAAALPGTRDSWFGRSIRSLFSGSSKARSRKDIAHHYDIGNDFYKLWLDDTMSYSCAYFQHHEQDLTSAQLHKIDHILNKLRLESGQTLLDIGSGWGWLIIRAAKRFGVKATGITHSTEQLRETRERIKREGLDNLVNVELADYRELKGKDLFDRIVSVGMFEHVGKANHRKYFHTVNRLLKSEGTSLLHTITRNLEAPTDPWLRKHIFPGCYIPSWREIIHTLPEWNFYLTDVESLRLHYALTLDKWAERFEHHQDKISDMFDERFIRIWRLYLRSSAAAFRSSGIDLHQFLFTKNLNNKLPMTREYMYNITGNVNQLS